MPKLARIVLALVTLVGAALLAPMSRASAVTPVLERRVIGHSVQGRDIVAYHLGERGAATTGLLIGQIHGDEPAGRTLARSLIDADRSVLGVNLWVVPTMNPDGAHAHTRQNAHGVDLNRNWPAYWQPLSGMYYSGPRALSEPETRALYDFLNTIRPHYVVVLHQPLYGVDTTTGGAVDPAFRHRLSAKLHLPEKPFRCWSFCHGSLAGWYTQQHRGVAETVEFGSAPARGYLIGVARWGIVSAMGGWFGELAARDPWHSLHVVGGSGFARVYGATFDPDVPGTPIGYTAYRDGHWYAHRHTHAPTPQLNASYHLSGAHGYSFAVPLAPGRHSVCLTFWNQGAGTTSPRVCRSVQIG